MESNKPAPKHYYSLILVEAACLVQGEIQLIRNQAFERSDIPHFPVARVRQLQNSSAIKIKNDLTPEQQASFQVIDLFILSITPLGQMTEDEFYAGLTVDQLPEPGVTANTPPPPAQPMGETATVLPFQPKPAE